MGKALYIESVEDAAAIAGGYDRLAADLGVSTAEVQRWCAGAAIPECALLLRVIDLVIGASDPRGRSTTAARAEECLESARTTRLGLEA
jgi:hypothetical protein